MGRERYRRLQAAAPVLERVQACNLARRRSAVEKMLGALRHRTLNDLIRDSPDDSQTNANIRALPASLQGLGVAQVETG